MNVKQKQILKKRKLKMKEPSNYETKQMRKDKKAVNRTNKITFVKRVP